MRRAKKNRRASFNAPNLNYYPACYLKLCGWLKWKYLPFAYRNQWNVKIISGIIARELSHGWFIFMENTGILFYELNLMPADNLFCQKFARRF